MNGTRPKPFVFVLMPFAREFDDVYRLGIKPACDDAGAYAERVDEQMFGESIVDRIYNQITKADVIIADMTGRNANVFYETGYAHALGKPVILLTRDASDMPFDLRNYWHLDYGRGIADLKPVLTKRIQWIVANPAKSLCQELPVEFLVNGSPLCGGLIVPIGAIVGDKARGIQSIILDFDVHNRDDIQIRVVRFKVGLVTSERFCESNWGKPDSISACRHPEGYRVHMREQGFVIWPGAWSRWRWVLNTREGAVLRDGDEERITLQVYVTDGPGARFPFVIRIKEESYFRGTTLGS